MLKFGKTGVTVLHKAMLQLTLVSRWQLDVLSHLSTDKANALTTVRKQGSKGVCTPI